VFSCPHIIHPGECQFSPAQYFIIWIFISFWKPNWEKPGKMCFFQPKKFQEFFLLPLLQIYVILKINSTVLVFLLWWVDNTSTDVSPYEGIKVHSYFVLGTLVTPCYSFRIYIYLPWTFYVKITFT
jgi:hypothetical protein